MKIIGIIALCSVIGIAARWAWLKWGKPWFNSKGFDK